jgi:membrane protein required for beta-lactamase induction
MKLIIILVCLGIIKYSNIYSRVSLQKFLPMSYVALLQRLLGIQRSWLVLTCLLAIPLLIVSLFYYGMLTAGSGYSLIAYSFSSFCLWLCLGQYPLQVPVLTDNTDAFLKHINQRLVALLFWFLLLNLVGVILYKLVTELEHASQDQTHPLANLAPAIHRLHALLDWLPIRLSLLFYALAGDFSQCVDFCIKSFRRSYHDNDAILLEGSALALGLSNTDKPSAEQLYILIDTLERSLAIALVFVGLFVLGAWIY